MRVTVVFSAGLCCAVLGFSLTTGAASVWCGWYRAEPALSQAVKDLEATVKACTRESKGWFELLWYFALASVTVVIPRLQSSQSPRMPFGQFFRLLLSCPSSSFNRVWFVFPPRYSRQNAEALQAVQGFQDQLNKATVEITKLRNEKEDLTAELEQANSTSCVPCVPCRGPAGPTESPRTSENLSSMLLEADRKKAAIQVCYWAGVRCLERAFPFSTSRTSRNPQADGTSYVPERTHGRISGLFNGMEVFQAIFLKLNKYAYCDQRYCSADNFSRTKKPKELRNMLQFSRLQGSTT
ncbi:hypothetical protein VOLCADRAFT_88876 [Volvox carteri f. nagariensis]|uniref:Uncharacterized protein n=1 Tax=Volvox carteri f. nagariensis TaxID=3068 RepID=D8TQ68_VOLCA|nr:uncharacterized protein VOLCADRAFT_88876 [Volvox carteri f. nagariensis]EFJ50482.1 hypothetical protein VOLCADRAFT_88876 [Volvox carteri f. nagariensis]|eukprot:XP_002948607.1 hypothetical protein VOLCADRAFT_88876 [Volvox carteri f. nagariensis]